MPELTYTTHEYAMALEELGHNRRLNRIPSRRTGPMAFKKARVADVMYLSLFVCSSYQRLLRDSAGVSHDRRPPVKVDGRGSYHRTDTVAISQGVAEALDIDCINCLPTPIPVRIGIECLTLTRRRQNTVLVHNACHRRGQYKVGPSNNGRGALPGAKPLTSFVQAYQRSGASGLYSHAMA